MALVRIFQTLRALMPDLVEYTSEKFDRFLQIVTAIILRDKLVQLQSLSQLGVQQVTLVQEQQKNPFGTTQATGIRLSRD